MKDIAEFSGEHRFLSNFYPSQIELDGKVYGTAEHAYQAYKTLDENGRWWIRQLQTPGQAKRAGRHVTIRADWEDIKVEVMRRVVRAKFDQNPRYAEWLLATGSAQLIEGNTWGDRFWGMCEDTGLNWLGRILMEIRHELFLKTLGAP